MVKQFGHTVRWIIIMASLLLLSNCSNFQYVPDLKQKKDKPVPVLTTTVYSGNFTTQEIRVLWQTCSVGFSQINPNYPPGYVNRHCDCYTDHVREYYKNSDDLRSLTPGRASALRQNLITECNLKIRQELQYQRNIRPT